MKKSSEGKIISVLSALAIGMTAFGAASVSADEETGRIYPGGQYDIITAQPGEIVFTDEIYELPEYDNSIHLNSYYGSNTYNFGNNLTSDQRSIYDQFRQALINDRGAEYCYIEIPGINTLANWHKISDDISIAFIALIMDCPEYIGLETISYSYSSSSPSIVKIGLTYCAGQAPGSTARNSYDRVESRVTSVVNAASGLSTPYEKTRFFAEYLCDNVVYDYNAAATHTGANRWNAYGALIDGLCVCEGYAEAFKLLCDNASIPCTTVVSDTHEWNIVNIDGSWYTVDVTWMDTGVNGKYDDIWFMAGTNTVNANDQESGHVLSPTAVLTNYKSLRYPVLSSTDYVPSSAPDPVPDVNRVAAEAFVDRLYENVLARGADGPGKENWVSQLMNGETAVNVAYGFIHSQEFLVNRNLSNRERVNVFYNTFLNRGADEPGMQNWLSQLNNGCSIDSLFYGFSQSPEFTDICASYGIVRGNFTVTEPRDKNLNLSAYVSRMYTKVLNRSFDPDGMNNWTGLYLDHKITAEGIAEGFINSTEFANRNLNDDEYVEVLYQTFFDRGSDAPGKANWLGQLRSGATRAEVLNGFLGSQEYRDLVASFGI